MGVAIGINISDLLRGHALLGKVDTGKFCDAMLVCEDHWNELLQIEKIELPDGCGMFLYDLVRVIKADIHKSESPMPVNYPPKTNPFDNLKINFFDGQGK
jgi:hypothetical protein